MRNLRRWVIFLGKTLFLNNTVDGATVYPIWRFQTIITALKDTVSWCFIQGDWIYTRATSSYLISAGEKNVWGKSNCCRCSYSTAKRFGAASGIFSPALWAHHSNSTFVFYWFERYLHSCINMPCSAIVVIVLKHVTWGGMGINDCRFWEAV